MVKQQALNMANLIDTTRDFTIYFSYKNNQLPYYLLGWEDLYLSSNPMEKAIYYIQKLTELTENKKKKLKTKLNAQFLTIPFELFVVDPLPYIKEIEKLLQTKSTTTTHKVMKKQKVPRKIISDGISLKIYKRCGWEPPKSNSNTDELAMRRDMAAKEASPKAMAVLDKLCLQYEQKYLSEQNQERLAS